MQRPACHLFAPFDRFLIDLAVLDRMELLWFDPFGDNLRRLPSFWRRQAVVTFPGNLVLESRLFNQSRVIAWIIHEVLQRLKIIRIRDRNIVGALALRLWKFNPLNWIHERIRSVSYNIHSNARERLGIEMSLVRLQKVVFEKQYGLDVQFFLFFISFRIKRRQIIVI